MDHTIDLNDEEKDQRSVMVKDGTPRSHENRVWKRILTVVQYSVLILLVLTVGVIVLARIPKNLPEKDQIVSKVIRHVRQAQPTNTTSSSAGITRIVINPSSNTVAASENPTFGGRVFGNVGAYEKIRGMAYGQLDPNDPRNAVITDLKYAPRNSAGMVEYSMDIYILKPVNLSRGNHKLFFEINNRGDKQLGYFAQLIPGNNPTTAADAGQAFLMNQGYTMAWCGWDFSAPAGPDYLRIRVPIAVNSDNSSITGPNYEYIVFDNPTTTTYTAPYPTNSTDTTLATLTVRDHLTDAPMYIPSANWTWVSPTQIALLPLNTTFKQSSIYELTYIAKDPFVGGIGFAATRDFVYFLRSTRTDNPLAGDVTRAVSWGFSQSARFNNDFISLGFNRDVNGNKIFDGVFNWVGGGSGVSLNYRFAQPPCSERNRQDHFHIEVLFPYSYTTLTDPFSGKTDGRLKRCTDTNTCPKIINTNSANEYWVKTGSLLHTDFAGNDLPDPPNVRHYLISSTQHLTSGSAPNTLDICQQFLNTNDPNPTLRALFVALDQWLDGKDPPPSMVPRVSDGTAVFVNITGYSPLGIGMVSQTSLNWPTIPKVVYTGVATIRNAMDYGPQIDQGILNFNPPRAEGRYYTHFVSKLDNDGNELAGIRLPPVTVPYATLAGWNLRGDQYGANDGCEHRGATIPFAPDMASRMIGDPRLSLTERYGNRSAYVAAVTAAANALAAQRLLLAADVQAYIAAAQMPIQMIDNPVYGSYTW